MIYKKFGKRRADFWSWTKTITSVSPIIGAWAKKNLMTPGLAVVAWMAGKGLLQDGSWLSGLAELLRKVGFDSLRSGVNDGARFTAALGKAYLGNGELNLTGC